MQEYNHGFKETVLSLCRVLSRTDFGGEDVNGDEAKGRGGLEPPPQEKY